MIAVIKTGAKQYQIQEKTRLRIEKLNASEGDEYIFDKVLLISDDNAGNVVLGEPFIDGAKVTARVVKNGKRKKILVSKYKNKTRYKKTFGHRQEFTEVEILKIEK
jgi:large subunit ribosomal protein L21